MMTPEHQRLFSEFRSFCYKAMLRAGNEINDEADRTGLPKTPRAIAIILASLRFAALAAHGAEIATGELDIEKTFDTFRGRISKNLTPDGARKQ